MPITTNLADLTVPGAYLTEVEPQPQVTPRSTGIVGIVGQSTWGPVNEAVMIGNLSEFIRNFGNFSATRDGLMAVLNCLKQGATQIRFVRVTDGNEAAASATLTNGATGIVTLVLEHPGTEGNNATAVVAASSVSGKVNITLKFNGQTKEFVNVDMTPDSADYFVDKVNEANTFMTATRVQADGVTTLPAAGTYTFSSGSDGTLTGASLTDADYIGTVGANSRTGIKIFEQADSAINILTSARASNDINDEIVSHVTDENLSARIGVISPAASTSVASLKTLMATYNSDFVVMAYPWLQVYNTYTKANEYFSAAPFYAGVLASLSPHVSPSRKPIFGINGTQLNLSNAEVKELTDYRVSMITLMPGLGYVIRNGFNTSSNGGKRQIIRRRMINFYENKWEPALAPFVSRGHTSQLREDIVAFFNADLERDARAGLIGSSTGGVPYQVICDASNNPTSVVQGNQLYVDVVISLIAPADKIIVRIDAQEENVNIVGS